MAIDHFRSLMVESSCEKGEEKLMSSWFNQVMELFTGEKSLVANLNLSPNQLNKFYECTLTLISNQVRRISYLYIRIPVAYLIILIVNEWGSPSNYTLATSAINFASLWIK